MHGKLYKISEEGSGPNVKVYVSILWSHIFGIFRKLFSAVNMPNQGIKYIILV